MSPMKPKEPGPVSSRVIKRLCLAFILLCGLLVAPLSYAETDIDLDGLLTELQRTLVRVRDVLADEHLPPFTSAILKVNATAKRTHSGEISLFVAQMNSDLEEGSVLEVELELKPPRPSDSVPVSAASDVLAEAIIRAARTIDLAQHGDPPLRPRQLTAAVSFLVSSTHEGGLDVSLDLLGLDLGTEARLANYTRRIQQIALVFDYD